MNAAGVGRDALIAIDAGTTNTKALLVDASDLRVLHSASRPVGIEFPRPGWVQQDAIQLWEATREAVRECAQAGEATGLVVIGLTIANQRESVVAWDRQSGEPIGPMLGWQDTRTESICRELRDRGFGSLIHQRTGLQLDPMYSAPKMAWLLEQAQLNGVAASSVLLGTVDTWLNYKLTGGFLTDASNASRTLLYDIHTLRRERELLDVFGLGRQALATVQRSDAPFGTVLASSDCGVSAGTPVVALLADSHSALYIETGGNIGQGKCTYGTGSSVMVPVPTSTVGNATGIATTVAWLLEQPTYAKEGNVLAVGTAIDWMADLLFGGQASALDHAAARSTHQGQCQFVPAFSGLGAPHFDRNAVALIEGMTASTSKDDLAWATLEAVAQQVADVVEAIVHDSPVSLDSLHADGGASRSDGLMQIQADVLGRSVHVSQHADASALGAALMGLRSMGRAESYARPAGREVQPQRSEAWRRRLRARWTDAVERSRMRL